VPPRPVVTDQGEVIASVPPGETSLGEGPPPPPPEPPPMAKTEASAHTLDSLLAEGEGDEDGSPAAGEGGRPRDHKPAEAKKPKPAKPTAGGGKKGKNTAFGAASSSDKRAALPSGAPMAPMAGIAQPSPEPPPMPR